MSLLQILQWVIAITEKLLGISLIGMRNLPDDFRPANIDLMFPKIQNPYYTQKSMLIGWFWKNPYDRIEKIKKWLPIDRSFHAYICSRTGSGKTFLLKRLLSCYYKSGMSCFVVDLHDEFSQCRNPLQEQFHKYLPKGMESAEGLKVFTIRPFFFNNFLEEKDKHSQYFQLSMKDISAQDLIDICNLEPRYNEIILKYFEKADNIEQLIDLIRKNEKAEPLIRILENLKNQNIIGNDFSIDLIEKMNNGHILVLNLFGYDRVPAKYYQIYLKWIISKLVNARKNKTHNLNGEKLHNELVMEIDEAHSLISPLAENTMSGREIIKQIRESRKFGVSIIFSSQDLKSVHSVVFEQTEYIFISFNADYIEVDEILKRRQYYTYHPSDKKEIADWLRHMKNFLGWRCWTYITTKGQRNKFFVYAPLCEHKSARTDN